MNKITIQIVLTLFLLSSCYSYKGLSDVKVENVVATKITSNSVSLTWDEVNGADHYVVALNDSIGMQITSYLTIPPNFQIDSLNANTQYCIYVGASSKEIGLASESSDTLRVRTLQ